MTPIPDDAMRAEIARGFEAVDRLAEKGRMRGDSEIEMRAASLRMLMEARAEAIDAGDLASSLAQSPAIAHEIESLFEYALTLWSSALENERVRSGGLL